MSGCFIVHRLSLQLLLLFPIVMFMNQKERESTSFISCRNYIGMLAIA